MTSDKARSTEARLNTMVPYVYTTLNTQTTNITANTTNITGLNGRLGSNAQQTFLGTLTQASAPGFQSHTGIGTISGTPTDVEFNAVNTMANNMADLLNLLIARLEASNILH